MSHQRLPSDWFLKSRLKLRHLQLLIALHEHRNLHHAARTLGIAQPAASKLLSEIELMLDVPLFTRHPRGVEPNEFGDAMVRRAQMILSELNEAADEISALKQGHSGVVMIGTVGAPAVELVIDTVKSIQRLDADLQISIQVDTSDVLVQLVEEAKLDFALCRIPHDVDPSPFLYQELRDESLSFLCCSSHPLARKHQIDLPDLLDAQWVLQPRGTLLRKRVDGLFHTAGLPAPHKVISTTSMTLTMALIRETDMLGVLPSPVAALYNSLGQYRILPFGQYFAVEPFGLVRRKDRPLSRGVQSVIEIMLAIARDSERTKRQPKTKRRAGR